MVLKDIQTKNIKRILLIIMEFFMTGGMYSTMVRLFFDLKPNTINILLSIITIVLTCLLFLTVPRQIKWALKEN